MATRASNVIRGKRTSSKQFQGQKRLCMLMDVHAMIWPWMSQVWPTAMSTQHHWYQSIIVHLWLPYEFQFCLKCWIPQKKLSKSNHSGTLFEYISTHWSPSPGNIGHAWNWSLLMPFTNSTQVTSPESSSSLDVVGSFCFLEGVKHGKTQKWWQLLLKCNSLLRLQLFACKGYSFNFSFLSPRPRHPYLSHHFIVFNPIPMLFSSQTS